MRREECGSCHGSGTLRQQTVFPGQVTDGFGYFGLFDVDQVIEPVLEHVDGDRSRLDVPGKPFSQRRFDVDAHGVPCCEGVPHRR